MTQDIKAKIVWMGVLFICFIIWILILSFFRGCAYAEEEINIPRLANAIYKAEGGSKTRHPYGILVHFKTTTPRQACINTIKHRLNKWDSSGEFISFLAKTYCPVGTFNDPMGLNRNWVKNVKHFYQTGA